MYRFLFIISFCASLFLSCEKSGEQTLARVNKTTISLDFFLPRYNDFLYKTQQLDNLLNRHIFLNTLIDEKLIIDYAQDHNMVKDPTVMREKQRMYDQLLLNTFFDHQIKPRTKATDMELRRLFTWSKTSLHVRHLFARNLAAIKAIQMKLQNGAEWNTLAKTCFNDPVLNENGGDLGWINMGEMDPAFEAVAYSLKDAEISNPVKTRYGYSIVQVVEREKDIFLTEQDFQLEKDWLKLMAAQYKKLPAIRAYTDSIETELGIVFAQNELKELYDVIISENESNKIFSRLPLVYFKEDNYWTVQETYNKLTNLSTRQYNHIASVKNLKQIIKGLAVRDVFLREAERLELSATLLFTDTFTQKYNSYLINLCLNNLYDTVPFDSDGRSQIIKTAYLKFRNKLADKSTITIDSLAVKSFVLNQRITS
jgi:hypothetical protein